MNISGLLEIFDQLPAFQALVDKLDQPPKEGNGPTLLGLSPGARPPVLARLFTAHRQPLLFVTARVEAVPIWQQALEAWLPPEVELLRFPEPTPLPFERAPWSDRSRLDRLRVLSRLMAGQHPLLPPVYKPALILTSIRALLQKSLPKRRFAAATRLVRAGQIVNLEKMVEGWQAAGYEPVSVVESSGQFSRRGGILDIFPPGVPYPIRIELFGDEVETLRAFDPATQRTIELGNVLYPPDRGSHEQSSAGSSVGARLDHVVIPPAREAMPGDLVPIGERLQTKAQSKDSDLPGWQDDIPDLAAGALSPHLEYFLPLAYPRAATLLDYLPENSWVVAEDLTELEQAVADLEGHARQIAGEQPDLPLDFPSPLVEWPAVKESMRRRNFLVLGDGLNEKTRVSSELAEAFQPGPRYGGQMRPFMLFLRHALQEGERTVVVSQQVQRLAELWREANRARNGYGLAGDGPVSNLVSLPPVGTISFVQGSLASGFTLEKRVDVSNERGPERDKILLNFLSDAEIFGWSRPAPRRRSQPRPVAPETYYADISPGDYVVHLEFGIGRFIGLVVRNIGGTEREYLQVRFGNSDVLYVPVHQADRLSKWVGPDDRKPHLHRLGEKSWKKTKAKAQKAIDDLADDLLDLYATRETIAGYAIAADSTWQAELEASFPYQETEDQLRAIAEVKSDMERPNPMDRLICGDVGYGKTEVALRAAFKAVMDNKQVAILVPTTVLAQQHFNTFRERLKPFPVTVEMLSRFRTAGRQEKIIQKLREGKIDIVIGTHRLLSDDVSFKDLGLLVIDEEQRFGVSHKEQLKQLRTEVDVLTMTATPIPRTLYMSLTGVRDISNIDTAPADRLPVQTYVGEVDDTLLRRAILRELDRGGQIFYVHNRVQSIENVLIKLSHLVPEATIAIGHGQMSERELEEVMFHFVDGSIDILLSTTIIESGLDIPNANTLIVDRADQFGLAQLYQLRGRVGRGIRRAYAYFFHPAWHRLTADAQARLEVIANQTELGAGYTIAMRDLEIRGAGDLLGSRQSGHIAAVGFDLYTRMLAQAVRRRKAARSGERIPFDLPEAVLIDLPLPAYVPTDYVPDASLRLRLYRRMAVLETLDEVDEMAVELADRFGPIPDPVDNLLYQLRIKVLATKARVPAVTTENGQLQIKLPEQGSSSRFQLQQFLGPEVRVSRKAVWMGRGLATATWQVALVQILERLHELADQAGLSSRRAEPTGS